MMLATFDSIVRPFAFWQRRRLRHIATLAGQAFCRPKMVCLYLCIEIRGSKQEPVAADRRGSRNPRWLRTWCVTQERHSNGRLCGTMSGPRPKYEPRLFLDDWANTNKKKQYWEVDTFRGMDNFRFDAFERKIDANWCKNGDYFVFTLFCAHFIICRANQVHHCRLTVMYVWTSLNNNNNYYYNSQNPFSEWCLIAILFLFFLARIL